VRLKTAQGAKAHNYQDAATLPETGER
jgi:hypothetical protein